MGKGFRCHTAEAVLCPGQQAIFPCAVYGLYASDHTGLRHDARSRISADEVQPDDLALSSLQGHRGYTEGQVLIFGCPVRVCTVTKSEVCATKSEACQIYEKEVGRRKKDPEIKSGRRPRGKEPRKEKGIRKWTGQPKRQPAPPCSLCVKDMTYSWEPVVAASLMSRGSPSPPPSRS